MDDLARQLVGAQAIRWQAGMLVRLDGLLPDGRVLYVESRDTGLHLWVAVSAEVTVESSPGPDYTRVVLRSWGPSKERVPRAWAVRHCVPSITDPATAACLAVQAMERGARFSAPPGSWAWLVPSSDPRNGWHLCPTLGEAAARALLAIHNGGTP